MTEGAVARREGAMKRRAMLLFGAVVFEALFGWYFRYVPIGPPGGGIAVWDRLKSRACFAPSPEHYSGPTLICTRASMESYRMTQ